MNFEIHIAEGWNLSYHNFCVDGATINHFMRLVVELIEYIVFI